jgi:hypothetical protein
MIVLLVLAYAAGTASLLPFFTGRRSLVDYFLMAIWPLAWLTIVLTILFEPRRRS